MSQTEPSSTGDDFRFWELLAFGAYVVGGFAIGLYAAFAGAETWERALGVFAVLFTVGTAAWLAGTALGFLFGVPRVRTGDPVLGDVGGASIVPNTNLEQISDWLTKIIVGATLVQLGPLTEGVGRLASVIGQSLGDADRVGEGTVMGGGVLVLYFVAGFIWGYLWCSLRVFREMQSLVDRERSVRASDPHGARQV